MYDENFNYFLVHNEKINFGCTVKNEFKSDHFWVFCLCRIFWEKGDMPAKVVSLFCNA